MRQLDYDITPSPMPDWLSADTDMTLPKYPTTAEQRILVETTYTNLFEQFLEMIAEGHSARRFITSDPRGITYGRFIRWVMSDTERKRRYEETQAISAESVMEDITDIVGHDSDSTNDVTRDALIINTLKWKMQVYNRKRYGDIKQLDVNSTSTINIKAVLENREQKLRVIEGTVIDS
jgi:hypothetical protein